MHFHRHHHRILAATLLAASLGGAAFAQPPEGPLGGPGRGEHHRFDADRLPPHLEALGLSDAQKAQIKALQQARRTQHEQTREADKALHESLFNLSPSAPNYTQEVDRIATLMGQKHADRIREGAAVRAQEWAILTPSQQSQLAAMPKPDFKKMRGHRGGNR